MSPSWNDNLSLTSTVVPFTSCPDILMVQISLVVGLVFGVPFCIVCKMQKVDAGEMKKFLFTQV